MRELLLRDFEDLMREAPTTYRSSNRCCRRISLIVMFRLKFGSKGERSAFPESIRPLRCFEAERISSATILTFPNAVSYIFLPIRYNRGEFVLYLNDQGVIIDYAVHCSR